MWHRESLGRNVFLGEVEVPLDAWDWDSEAVWLPLQPRVRPPVRAEGPRAQTSSSPHRALPSPADSTAAAVPEALPALPAPRTLRCLEAPPRLSVVVSWPWVLSLLPDQPPPAGFALS